MNEIIGVVALILGVLFVLIGLGAAWRESQRQGSTAGSVGPQGIDLATLIEALAKLVEALTKAQFWLATTFVGMFLIGYGSWVLEADPF